MFQEVLLLLCRAVFPNCSVQRITCFVVYTKLPSGRVLGCMTSATQHQLLALTPPDKCQLGGPTSPNRAPPPPLQTERSAIPGDQVGLRINFHTTLKGTGIGLP